MNKELIFKGSATALITPFKNDKIDYHALKKLIEYQIDGKTDALVIGGTTGEAATLKYSERERLYSFVRDEVGGRVKIIFGTGTNETKTVIKHTALAERIGCDGVLIVTPYYNKGTSRGVVEHYKRIAESTSLPILLYNVPSRTGVNLSIEQLFELSEIKNIVGIKEASDSVDRLCELATFKDSLRLYAGNDSQIYPVLSLGGYGVISVASNIYPKIVSKLCRSYFDNDRDTSLDIQLSLLPLIKALFRETNPAPVKYAASLLGLCSPELRLPLYEITDANKALLKQEMERCGKMFSQDGKST